MKFELAMTFQPSGVNSPPPESPKLEPVVRGSKRSTWSVPPAVVGPPWNEKFPTLEKVPVVDPTLARARQKNSPLATSEPAVQDVWPEPWGMLLAWAMIAPNALSEAIWNV